MTERTKSLLALGAAVAGIAGAILWGGGARAHASTVTIEAVCSDEIAIREALAVGWHQSQTHAAPTEEGMLMMLFQDNQGSAWSLVLGTGEDLLCIIASGHGWQRIDAPIPDGEGM